MCEAKKIIGINIIKAKEGYKINQKDYINTIIKRFMMNKTKQAYVPCNRISREQRENSELVDVTKFKSLLGLLLYIATKTRSDIDFLLHN